MSDPDRAAALGFRKPEKYAAVERERRWLCRGHAFEGPLTGLFLAEAEFADDAAMAAFFHPAFAVREVTRDIRYTGGELARHGVPVEVESPA